MIAKISGDPDATNNYNKLLRLLRFPRLYRLLKILRLFKMVKLFSTSQNFNRMIKKLNLNQGLVKMVNVLINILFLNHIVGCLWFFIVGKLLFCFNYVGKNRWFFSRNLGLSLWLSWCWCMDSICCCILLGISNFDNSRIWRYCPKNTFGTSYHCWLDDGGSRILFIHHW